MGTNNLYNLSRIWRLTSILVITVVFSIGCSSNNQRIKVPELPPPVVKRDKPVRVALVLGSGGFRGAAHVGVLEVLEENDIQVDLIVGSSAGSFVGAFYADEPNALALKQKLLNARYEHLIDHSWVNALCAPFCPTGPVRGKALQNFMLNNMRSRDFSELKIQFVVVTTSLANNKMELLQTGPIIPAVHASTALPPYFAPVHIYQNTLVDGGIISRVPVNVAKEFNPQMIIAVDISKQPSLADLENAFQITSRAIDISYYELAKSQASEADFVIRPDIIGYGTFEDAYNHEFYEAGRTAALKQIAGIKEAFLKIK